MKIKSLAIFLFFSCNLHNAFAQSAPPETGNAMASARDAATPVDNFTGIPSISFPLYSYSHPSGLSLNMSLDYFAGGIKVTEAPAAAGLGWNLSVGGAITRTTRGIPDDCPRQGYLYVPHAATDSRTDIWTYDNNCVDAEQDIFQFNFCGMAGKFYIGKDSQLVITPLSKLRIKMVKDYYDPDGAPPGDTVQGTITKFIITTNDGIKYVFAEREFQLGYANNCGPYSVSSSRYVNYASAWHLSQIISQTGKDTIKFTYTTLDQQLPLSGNAQRVNIFGGVASHSDTSGYHYDITTFKSKVPLEISLPNSKKISLYYSATGQYRFSVAPLLRNVKIMDSVLRFGYLLNWDTTSLTAYSRDFLMGLSYYTNNHIKQGYKFTYNTPYFSTNHLDTTDYSYNKKDHWGYYNGANNRHENVPTVTGFYTGANREPTSAAVASTLSSVTDPAGGITYYKFENNDIYPYDPAKQAVTLHADSSTSNSISISRVLGSKSYFRISLATTITRTGTSPISGSGNLVIKLTDLSGTPVSALDTIDLKQLYYNGIADFSFVIPNGSYLIKTNLGSGTSSSVSLLSYITWFNQDTISGTGKLSGGIRIKQISHYDPFTAKTDTLVTYKYLTEAGKSSGFLGAKPVYDYYLNNSYHYILSNPSSDLNFSEGISTGYSRVEVIKGSVARNLGKQIYYYTNVEDQDFDITPVEFPYVSRQQRDWAWGLPKKTMVYDHSGRLLQKTVNTYNYLVQSHAPDTMNISVKTGDIGATVTNSIQNYVAEKYYPECGLAQLTATADTFYHPDASVTTSWKTVVYDTNYNVKKITTPYDLNRGLNLEERIYYPYNYTIDSTIGMMRDSSIFMPVSKEIWITGDAYPRLLSASITDYQQLLYGGFVPLRTYALQSNAPVLQTTIGTFDSSKLVRDTVRLVAQQDFLFDQFGALLQSTNSVTGVKNCMVYGVNDQAVIAKVANTGNFGVSYTGFEKNAEGGFNISSAARDTSAITGTQSFNLSSQSITRTRLNADVIYMISYWTKGSVSISGATSAVLSDSARGWHFYTRTITGVSSITITGSGLIDELRLYPVTANMLTTSYNDNGLPITVCDANNSIVYNEYDSVNRLKVVRNKDRNVIKKYDYSDSIRVVNFSPAWTTQYTDSIHWPCELDSNGHNTGRVLRFELDTAVNSESYMALRKVFDHIDSVRCTPPQPDCGTDPAVKAVNYVCETGCKDYTSSEWKKVLVGGAMVFRWVCTYHYVWSDYSTSDDYEEYNTSPCAGGGCIIYDE